jgi:riboflavin synthase
MFTGIVEAVGRIVSVSPSAGGSETGVRLAIDARTLDCSDVAIGDSVAVNGACLTVVQHTGNNLEFDVSAETLRRTVGLSGPGPVNLEKALRFGDRLGGHLVAGHVDGIGRVIGLEATGENRLLSFDVPDSLRRYLATKGSITVDGVSLTVNWVDATRFSVNLIPHTLAMTTLGILQIGSQVNLEVDLIARYLERLVSDRFPTP